MSGGRIEFNFSKMSPEVRRRAVEKMSSKERLTCVRRMYVKYPRTEEILKRIAYIHAEAFDLSEDMEPENNLLFTGAQGAGKTRVIARYKKQYQSEANERESDQRYTRVTHVPILIASIPHKATDKAVVTELLRQIGDPDPADGSAEEQTIRLFHFIHECGVEIIILDEFQHIIDADSDKVLMKVANFLKRILKETRKPLILAGMPHSVRILDNNPQFNRLFTKRMSIEPLAWSDSEEKSCEMKAFLRQIDDLLPFPERSNLSDHATAYKFHMATGGVVAKVMKLVRKAAEFVIGESRDFITEVDLYRAFKDQLEDQDIKVKNQFLTISQRPGRTATPKSAEKKDTGGINRRVLAIQEKVTGKDIFSRG